MICDKCKSEMFPTATEAAECERRETTMASDRNYWIVRAARAGVFAGEIVRREGQEVEMKNARRLLPWKGAVTLSQLAMEGVKCPNECNFPCVVHSVIVLEVIEILQCTDAAKQSIQKTPVWQV